MMWLVTSLSGDSYTIVGVLPRDFVCSSRELSSVPLDKFECEKRRAVKPHGIGRSGWRVPQAAMADLQAIAAQLEGVSRLNKDRAWLAAALGNYRSKRKTILLTLWAGIGWLIALM
jgi:hypothetical protein